MTELSLSKGVPVLVTPAITSATVQNAMDSNDDKLLASTSGVTTEKWTVIEPGDSIKFSSPMYLMQKSWDVFVFPVIEV